MSAAFAACVSGLSIWNSSNARSPSPCIAVASTAHSAACVYCAPFSRTPGTYPLMYPGSCVASIERRRQQHDQSRILAHQMRFQRSHRLRLPRGTARAGDHAPALRDRIDAALLVLRGSQRRAVIEVRAAIPLRRPTRAPRRPSRTRRPARASSAASPHRRAASACDAQSRAASTMRNHASHTLSPLPARADAAHAVVPVAGADQRQSMRARSCTRVAVRAGNARTRSPCSSVTDGRS